MRRNIMLDVMFTDCQELADPANLRHLGDLLAQHGFQMIVFPVPKGEGVVLKGAEIGEYLVQIWPQEVLDAKPVLQQGYPGTMGRRLLAAGMEELLWTLALGFKVERIEVIIGGLVDFEFRDQRAWVEPFAQRLLKLAQSLYPELQPALAAVYESSTAPSFEDVLKRKLKHINWVNIFGPPYVDRYGREFLLGLPGHKIKELPDGGIFHQLTPTFLTDDPQAAKALRQEVIAYCAQAGLKVTCKAPYYLPGVTPTAPAPTTPQVSDEELQTYLKEMLGVTLLLDDGTRVKPIYIEWDALTLPQRQTALNAVKAAAIAEIRQHRDKRIRFEFNALPDELDQMMADLVGRDNPDFEYVQVEMES